MIFLTPLTVIAAIMLSSPSQAIPNPASVLCASMGYTQDKNDCLFPDNTRCNQWAFWRGECGENHHICAKNNGKIVTVKKAPLCDIDGRLYRWDLKRNRSEDGTQWQVVLLPEETGKFRPLDETSAQ